MRAKAGIIDTLFNRRERATLRFAEKAAANPRFASWFPKRRNTGTRGCQPYYEKISRTERNRNSPINYMIRRLNESRMQQER